MRAVAKPNFCKVCLEGLWWSLFKRVDLIDDIRERCVSHALSTAHPESVDHSDSKQKWTKILDLQLVPLAHLRDVSVHATEDYSITWTKDGELLDEHTNRTSLVIDDEDAIGRYEIDVVFTTEEVKVDRHGLLVAKAEYIVNKKCQ